MSERPSPGLADGDPAVEMAGISRRFGAVQALDGVDLAVRSGDVHALVGENGAGKTTLMRILYGADRPDAGRIRVHGQEVRLGRAADGIALGIGMVSQHYSIISELSCLENLMLGAEPGLAIDIRTASRRAEELAAQMGFEFDWHRMARDLSPAAAQKLEILKLLWRNARIMILDEPTAMLTPADSDSLFDSLRSLAKAGATIIVVTHRLPEVFAHCRRVTVLRGGRLVWSGESAETHPAALAEQIVGRAVETEPRPSAAQQEGELLGVEGLTAYGYRGDEAVRDVSFSVRPGEMLGIAGVDGSGQRELMWALLGLGRSYCRELRFEGRDIRFASPRHRLALGFRIIPEDRHAEGVVDEWSLVDNVGIGIHRDPALANGPALRLDAWNRLAGAVADRFSTKHGGLQEPMISLSGGNQQRFVAARALAIGPRLILAYQPARGLDIEATRRVYQGLAEACEQGSAAIVVSYDLDELVDHCDRVVAMERGRWHEPAAGSERDRAAIGRLMVAS